MHGKLSEFLSRARSRGLEVEGREQLVEGDRPRVTIESPGRGYKKSWSRVKSQGAKGLLGLSSSYKERRGYEAQPGHGPTFRHLENFGSAGKAKRRFAKKCCQKCLLHILH